MVYTRPWLWLMCIGGSSSRSSNLAGHLTARPPPQKKKKTVHPIRLTWNLRFHTPWKRFKIIFQTIIFSGSMFIFQGFPGCISPSCIVSEYLADVSAASLYPAAMAPNDAMALRGWLVDQLKKPNDMRKFKLQLQAFFCQKTTCWHAMYIYIV